MEVHVLQVDNKEETNLYLPPPQENLKVPGLCHTFSNGGVGGGNSTYRFSQTLFLFLSAPTTLWGLS
jgi:hypothetical protein